jgi:hypothetical protein
MMLSSSHARGEVALNGGSIKAASPTFLCTAFGTADVVRSRESRAGFTSSAWPITFADPQPRIGPGMTVNVFGRGH